MAMELAAQMKAGSSMPIMRVVGDLVVGEWDVGTPSR
jgi:hypothetical protein